MPWHAALGCMFSDDSVLSNSNVEKLNKQIPKHNVLSVDYQ